MMIEVQSRRFCHIFTSVLKNCYIFMQDMVETRKIIFQIGTVIHKLNKSKYWLVWKEN